jgi:acetyltransferase-like isoleucine patch superfamily enzyme
MLHPRISRVLIKLKIKFILAKKNVIDIKSNFCNLNINIIGEGNILKFSKTSDLVDLSLEIKGNNNSIIIEEGVRIGGGKIVIEENNSRLFIGKKTTIESNILIGLTENDQLIHIGEDCMISDNVQIRNGDSHSIIDIENGSRINPSKSILIGNHVWVGSNTIILKGVEIGDNSIIGIQSVVTKKIAKNSIYAGIPAKKIRDGITWQRECIPVKTIY